MFEKLAKLCAIVAGVLMVFIIVLTCYSILGRKLFDMNIPGDFELVGLATGAAVGLFMPQCQLHRGNIVVDFFTAKLPHQVNEKLDRLGALMLGLCFALLAYRATLGGSMPMIRTRPPCCSVCPNGMRTPPWYQGFS